MRIPRRTPHHEIPTSSMADIAFLLIIFFMVTSVFSATKGLVANNPEIDGSEPDPAVLVHVRESGVFVDCTPMDDSQIREFLMPRMQRDPNAPVILYVDPQVEYGAMIHTYDLLTALPVNNVSVPSGSDVKAYIAAFGVNPFASHCPD